MDATARTAIGRHFLSAPARYVKDKHYISGRILDYGCGRGRDADELGAEKYDPNFFPERPVGPFNVILCTYVLNVIRRHEDRQAIIDDVMSLLAPGGGAFFSVRDDERNLLGETSWGTYQGVVRLDFPMYLLRHKKGHFKIYAASKDDWENWANNRER